VSILSRIFAPGFSTWGGPDELGELLVGQRGEIEAGRQRGRRRQGDIE